MTSFSAVHTLKPLEEEESEREDEEEKIKKDANDRVSTGSAITNGREPRSCLGRVFNSKLGCFATPGCKCIV